MKVQQTGSHLDHMLRQTRMHHVHLSSMADTKANLLLTLSAVMLTLVAPHVMRPIFHWPALILILFCLATVCLAIYAVMPKIPLGKESNAKDPASPSFNLLFFGDFTAMSYPEFEGEMEKVLKTPARSIKCKCARFIRWVFFWRRRNIDFSKWLI